MRRHKDDEKRIRSGAAKGIPSESEIEAFAKRMNTTPSRATSVLRIVKRERATRAITQATRGRKPEKKAGKPVTEKTKSKEHVELSDEGPRVDSVD